MGIPYRKAVRTSTERGTNQFVANMTIRTRRVARATVGEVLTTFLRWGSSNPRITKRALRRIGSDGSSPGFSVRTHRM